MVFCWFAALSIGRFLLLLPLLELAAGAGYLLRWRRGLPMLLAVGVMLYGLQLAALAAHA